MRRIPCVILCVSLNPAPLYHGFPHVRPFLKDPKNAQRTENRTLTSFFGPYCMDITGRSELL